MSNFVGPFLGFSIGGIHSSELKIVRISSGDRYEQNLLPDFKDRTVEVPGGNGSYYFGRNFTNRKFTINFAFDSLTEYEIRKMIQILSFEGLQPLVFDETPYKHYMVKCASSPQLKYICFEGKNFVDIYKGEGVLNLVSYYPYGIGETQCFHGNPENFAYLGIYNNGDLPSDNFRCFVGIPSLHDANISIYLTTGNYFYSSSYEQLGELALHFPQGSVEEDVVAIDFRTHQIIGVENFTTIPGVDVCEGFSYDLTTNIYNKYIASGDFFKIPLGSSVLYYLINSYAGGLDCEYSFLYY